MYSFSIYDNRSGTIHPDRRYILQVNYFASDCQHNNMKKSVAK